MHEIVADTSPLIALSGIRLSRPLPLVFGKVFVPRAVIRELIDEGVGWQEAAEIQSLLGTVEWLQPAEANNDGLLRVLRTRLGAGEAEAIAIASTRGLPVLLDDLEARKTAGSLGLQVIGTLGVVARCKRCGMIPAVRPLIEAMKLNGIFYADSLIERFLREVNET